MGPKNPVNPPRVVLDTNVLVSALLFPRGETVWLREAWQAGRLVPLVGRDTTQELIRVLHYPKFKLTRGARDALLADFLPWVETVHPVESSPDLPVPRDSDDLMFLTLATTAQAEALVTGDADLLALADRIEPLRILTPAAFRDFFVSREYGG